MNPEIIKVDFKQQLEFPETLELYLYSEIAPGGYDFWSGSKIESETSQNYFRDKLTEYKDVKFINLFVNSAGGSVREGYGIYAQLKRHPAQKTAYIDGFANSISSIIVMACDKVVMRANSIMGIHNMVDACLGNAAEHRKCAEDLDRMMEGNRQIYLKRSGGKIDLEKLTGLLDAETLLTAQDCFDYGFCDEIAGEVTDPEKVAQMMQRMNGGIAQQVQYFLMLKQSFGMAMEVAKSEIPPAKEPKENKPLKFLEALMR